MLAEPVRLSRTFSGRRVEALLSPVGASIQGLVVDGLPVVCGDPRGPVASSGAVLVPWPNRVRDGRWTLDGRKQQLELTEPDAGNAIHGLVAATRFSVIESDGSSAAFGARISRPPGYPFELDVFVSYRLVAAGIRCTITVVNRGGRRAPVAVGVHPYLQVGDAPAAELRVQIDARSTLLLGADDLPSRRLAVDGSRYDLRAPTPLTVAPAHAAYSGLRSRDGRVALRLDDVSGGRAVRVWADQRFRWAQLYVTDALPGLGGGRVAVALEPMTAPPDALNSGTDLHWMEPRSRWQLDWGIARETHEDRDA